MPVTNIKKQETLDKIPCQYLKGVGPHLAKLLEKCHILTIQDILFHLPYRYQDRTCITSINAIKAQEWVVIEGTIHTANTVKRKSPYSQFICDVFDDTGHITLRFFRSHMGQHAVLIPGMRIRCFGEARYGNQGLLLIHPEYQLISSENPLPVEECLTPLYPSTEGLSQNTFRKITTQALALLSSNPDLLPDYLPEMLLKKMHFMSLSAALHYVHRPPANAPVADLLEKKHPAQLRLAFEELLAYHLSLKNRRYYFQQHTSPSLILNQNDRTAFLKQLPYALTNAQTRVLAEIAQDLKQSKPMLRLLQGDVGSGKTVIAALTTLSAVSSGYQAAFMAPTDLLAQQHYQQFQQWFSPLGFDVIWLNRQLTAKERQHCLQRLASHEAHIAVSTHALFQQAVQFAKLGLVLIDEQHRFGVEQRLALREKGIAPHQLIMTATPIPRTLAMTVYADLQLSIIDELPKGRLPIKTVVISEERRDEIIARIREVRASKHQIYWVCPLIDTSDALQCSAAETTMKLLQQHLPELRIGLVHGRIKSQQREQIMEAFKDGNLDLLVATTVIEVGIDVPKASLMVIENAERLGLSQLHQLRGRVGRGSVNSYCLLLYRPPLSQIAKERLAIIRSYQDGFIIAEKDLQLRGPGELLGTRQSGLATFRIADLKRDVSLLSSVLQIADEFFSQSSRLSESLVNRWLNTSADSLLRSE